MSWFVSRRSAGRQGLVICEQSGRNVAVAYDGADAPVLAAAPDLLAACSGVAEDSRLVCNLETGEKHYPITPDEMGAIRRAIAKARGTA